MPKRSKRSAAAKLRWQKERESEATAPCDHIINSVIQSSNLVNESVVSFDQTVSHNYREPVSVSETPEQQPQQRRQCDASTAQQVSYADVVKTGCHGDSDSCAAGPSHTHSKIHTYQSSETHVCASRSQNSLKYGKYRNQQCTCNSLVFLSFLYENENITRADLDGVLDKGHVMYTVTRKRFPRSVHLATDELPSEVPARTLMYHADMTQLSRYGTLELEPTVVDNFLDLEAGLSCLLSEVQYALLIMSGLCIAVFRTRSGRYGLFDPHSRQSDGLPLPMGSVLPGTALMLTFTHLSDMIDRIKMCHKMFNTNASCNYELKPVNFHSVNTAKLNDAVTNTQNETTSNSPSGSTSVLAPDINSVVTDCCKDTVNQVRKYMDIQPQSSCHSTKGHLDSTSDESFKLGKLSKNQRRKFKRRQLLTERVPQEKQNKKTKERQKYALNEMYRAKKKSYSIRRYSNETFRQLKLNYFTNWYHTNSDIKQKHRQRMKNYYINNPAIKLKLNQYQKKQYRENLTFQQKRKQYIDKRYHENPRFMQKQKQYMTKRYHEDPSFMQKQKQYITKRYHEDPSFMQKQKQYITTRYHEDPSFMQKQKQYITTRYYEDPSFMQKQKQYITTRYHEDPSFMQKQKQYITTRYHEDPSFMQKQKQYITTRYYEDPSFMQKQKQYITTRYHEDPNFTQKQKQYITKRYQESSVFREKQRAYVTTRYAQDSTFRKRHKQQMKQIMRDRYRNNFAFQAMHKMRCAMNIKRKYRRINRRMVCYNSENSLINEAISDFQSCIKSGPTYVCTVCHKASFPNQVVPCQRSKYVKNPHVVTSCLTGKYVHVCDEKCTSDQQCKMPDERKKEWICHTCHDYVKKGAMPPLAVANNLELADIPPELCDLNILERHLIAKCIPFAKIIPLPKGRQRAIRGNVVCVPSEVQETVETLPRLRSESQVMRVKLKRRLCYRGHQLFQTVTWSKLIQALHKLKHIHPEYEHVNIRDEAELCDPTLPDEHDDDNDENEDEIMHDDYDADDLMEIDMFDKNALQAENEHEQNIDMQSFDDVQPVEQRPDAEQEGDMPNGGFALESCLQPTDVSEEILCFTAEIYSVAPAERNTPVSFFKTPNLEAMAFPVQFPTSQNTLDEKRRIKLTPSKYFKARLFCIDERFARDTNYLFFAQFVIEIHLATSSMTIQLRKGKALTRDGRKITSKMIQDKKEVDKLVRNKDAVRFMQPLRGTPAYWEKTTKDLFAMIRQLGTPTFFCTFSAAEMRWPEVIVAIKRQQGEDVDFDSLDWSAKCDILRSNPVTAMRMFDKRVEALFRDLLLSAAEPLGKVIDFFYRVEFQHRGSPHIHCLLWIEGAPVFEEDDDQTVYNFVSRYITAQLPDPQIQPELYKKVKEVQIHSKNHSRTCFKYPGANCRFGFPKPPSRKTMITRPMEEINPEEVLDAKIKLRPLLRLLNEPLTASLSFQQLLSQCKLTVTEYERCLHLINQTNVVILKREPEDCWVNGYNPHLLQAWDANIDVSYIHNAYACVVYITSYITKQEAKLSEYLKTVIQNSNMEHVNESDEMREIMQAYSKKREISAQECVARACGLNLKKCSRGVVFIPTDDNPLKMSQPLSYLQNKTPECSDVWMTSLTDKYKCRPETPEFESMCLADFAATCRFVYGQKTKGASVFPLLNDMGFVQQRQDDKPAVIRFYRVSKEKYPEKFYGTLLKLYVPHRSEAELKTAFHSTYESFYNNGCVQLPGSYQYTSVKQLVKQNREKYEANAELIEEAIQQFEQNQEVIDEWSNLGPESEVVRLECVAELEAREQDSGDEQENVPDFSREANAATETRVIREVPAINPALLRQMYQNLNQKQACVFYTVRDWCIKRVCGLNPDPFFFYINGGAGTGKSHLIKCIYSEASKILIKLPRRADEADISKPTVLLTAFTGTAAFNISGTTLHSLLKLPRSLKPPFQGLGNKLDEVRCELINAEIMIIDEVSMVSKPLFAYVDARLKQIKGSQKPFGGMSLLAVGDFYQLPPVRQTEPLCVYNPLQLDLWKEHFQMVTLTEIMRQKDDVAFAEMLNRIRVKDKTDEMSDADRALLSQAVTEPVLCPTDVLHIFATNKQVDAHNCATLSKFHAHVTVIDADDYKKDPRTGRMARLDNPVKGGRNELPDTLEVAEGARVMITRNLDVAEGLVNGSFATLIKVVTSEENGCPHVTKLGLKMDDETAGRGCGNTASTDNLVYIDRSEENLKQKRVVRRQFPIKLAFACTIHKVQGMTRTSAVVSLKHIFEPGMAYVAISRVTSLSGLHIIDMDESKIYANSNITAALDTMNQISLDDIMPLLKVKQTLSNCDTLTVVHHNTEGLLSHVNDIKSHHELCLADVLCLTETHLRGSFVADVLRFQGYTMFKRNRHLSYTNIPQMANKHGGGVVIYVKGNIQVHEKRYVHNVTDLEFVALKVEAPVSALIAAVYRPPDYCMRSFLSNLNSLLDSLEIMDCHPIIVCGDFNEDPLSYGTKPVLQLFQSRGYEQVINIATTEKDTLLDLIFISRPQICLHSGVMQSYYSYHNPVYCVLSTNHS